MKYMGGSFEFTPDILASNIIGEANEQIGVAEEEFMPDKVGSKWNCFGSTILA